MLPRWLESQREEETVKTQRDGGVFGVRDYGLLEAELYRPQTGYYAYLIAGGPAFVCSRVRSWRLY